MEAGSLAALPGSGSRCSGEKGRPQEAKPAFSDDWSKASYLNFWFYSSIKGS